MEYNSLLEVAAILDETKEEEIEIVGNINETAETVNYDVNTIYYKGNLVLDGQSEVNGATLTNKVYEFGNTEKDVATETEYAKNMVILEVDGNLTIDSGVTLTACKSASGYGGPKGLLIYCTGTLINNGSISMTARGAKAEGQNIYLFDNIDGSYEYIPKEGVPGGGGASGGGGWKEPGRRGGSPGAATDRRTGGGGGGSSWYGGAGNGTAGTSYSGGTGGGSSSTPGWWTSAQSGEANGGKGGNASSGSSEYTLCGSGGGAGNPGGYSAAAYSSHGQSGTGGLLIIYAGRLENNASITSNGSVGGTAYRTGGGGSGGGSVNIFYDILTSNGTLVKNSGTITAYGGSGGAGTRAGESGPGGNGGNGCVTKGILYKGTFVGE